MKIDIEIWFSPNCSLYDSAHLMFLQFLRNLENEKNGGHFEI